jgi:hypothetical protein
VGTQGAPPTLSQRFFLRGGAVGGGTTLRKAEMSPVSDNLDNFVLLDLGEEVRREDCCKMRDE